MQADRQAVMHNPIDIIIIAHIWVYLFKTDLSSGTPDLAPLLEIGSYPTAFWSLSRFVHVPCYCNIGFVHLFLYRAESHLQERIQSRCAGTAVYSMSLWLRKIYRTKMCVEETAIAYWKAIPNQTRNCIHFKPYWNPEIGSLIASATEVPSYESIP